MASRLKLKDILDFLGRLAPWDLAESWDNVGLMAGDPEQEARGVLVALDPTMPVIDEALERGANIILTHHPLIFHPIKSINTSTSFGRILHKILSHDLAVVSCHTNLDIIEEGVSASLAHLLNLQKTTPLIPAGEPGRGFGKIGDLPAAMAGELFLRLVARQLKLTAITMAGFLPQTVGRVALCGGSGSEFAEKALQAGADIYLTGELKHATARWAEENRFCIIDASHFATENTVIPHLVSVLQDLTSKNNSTVPVIASQRQTSPLHHYFFDTSIL
ncbi:MAG: Nif3-like dinuclear metal center hexameric protein [Thermodesulfobacteriota bacterium]